MTRIIAGELGGRRIAVPPKGTRPTSDRVREAMFSRLDHADVLRGAHVIDLFAGSGALGIEALSRGAAHATFVELAAAAVRTIEANVGDLGCRDRATVVKDRALAYLTRATPSPKWSLALIDPPYEIGSTDLADVLAALAPHLADDATVVVEWSTRAGEPIWPPGVGPMIHKKYGDTTVHFAQAVR